MRCLNKCYAFLLVFDDSSYGRYVRRAFRRTKEDRGSAEMSKLFTELVAGGSAVEVEFQVADLLAHEGFKLLNDRKIDQDMRLWLRKLLGSKTPIQITRFTDENFKDMLRMIKSTKEGRPLEEGVTSKLAVSVQGLHTMGIVINNAPLASSSHGFGISVPPEVPDPSESRQNSGRRLLPG